MNKSGFIEYIIDLLSDYGNITKRYMFGGCSLYLNKKIFAIIIDTEKAMNLWIKALNTKWNKVPVWIHGDFAIGNMLMKDDKLSAVIDFGGMGMGSCL